MIPVRLTITLVDRANGYERHHLQRAAGLHVVPRKGEAVEISPGGWTEDVRNVWHDLAAGAVYVDFADVQYDADHEDLRAMAQEAGWR
jgi:hypothetical protein